MSAKKRVQVHRPYVLAYYDPSVPELPGPGGGRNPYDAYEYELVSDGTEEEKARKSRAKGTPVDILNVRMSGFP